MRSLEELRTKSAPNSSGLPTKSSFTQHRPEVPSTQSPSRPAKLPNMRSETNTIQESSIIPEPLKLGEPTRQKPSEERNIKKIRLRGWPHRNPRSENSLKARDPRQAEQRPSLSSQQSSESLNSRAIRRRKDGDSRERKDSLSHYVLTQEQNQKTKDYLQQLQQEENDRFLQFEAALKALESHDLTGDTKLAYDATFKPLPRRPVSVRPVEMDATGDIPELDSGEVIVASPPLLELPVPNVDSVADRSESKTTPPDSTKGDESIFCDLDFLVGELRSQNRRSLKPPSPSFSSRVSSVPYDPPLGTFELSSTKSVRRQKSMRRKTVFELSAESPPSRSRREDSNETDTSVEESVPETNDECSSPKHSTHSLHDGESPAQSPGTRRRTARHSSCHSNVTEYTTLEKKPPVILFSEEINDLAADLIDTMNALRHQPASQDYDLSASTG
ncbi:hypothetical protein MMC20_003164 [Loxospora ochrophaea]|nr:hypothetical protein [Loxospora ochrophaea]